MQNQNEAKKRKGEDRYIAKGKEVKEISVVCVVKMIEGYRQEQKQWDGRGREEVSDACRIVSVEGNESRK